MRHLQGRSPVAKACRAAIAALLGMLWLGTPLYARAAAPGIAAPAPNVAKVALLRLALAAEPDIPFAAARIGGMGRDQQGRWWVQGWTEARAEFHGEPGEQWFVVWDGTTWTHHAHGTGLERSDIAGVKDWREPPTDAPRSETLITPGYVVMIDWRCPEGEVSCEAVTYTGTSRKTGATVTLNGRSLHTACRGDPATPCRFIGYRFTSGDTAYFVGENGVLQVTRGRRVLLQEQGRWDYQ